jgi:hypothetical protein
MDLRCPWCHTLVTVDPSVATQVCPHCQRAVPPGAPRLPERVPTPWERRKELGLVRGFGQTAWLSVSQPAQFYETVRPDAPWGEALLYGWLVRALAAALTLPFQLLAMAANREQMQRLLESMEGEKGLPEPFRDLFHALLAATPLQVALFFAVMALLAPLGFLLQSALYHVAQRLFGGGQAGFGATVRAVTYASTPHLVSGVPVVGLASLYALVLYVFGMRGLHRSDWGPPIAALFSPMLLCCFCGCGGMLLFAMAGQLFRG